MRNNEKGWRLVAVLITHFRRYGTCHFSYAFIENYYELIKLRVENEVAEHEIELPCAYGYNVDDPDNIAGIDHGKVLAVSASGTHKKNLSDKKVSFVYIKQSRSSFLPNGIGTVFFKNWRFCVP